MTDEMRAEFEVAFRAQFGFGATDVAESKSEDGAVIMGAALWAWQASREAVVVELPPRKRIDHFCYDQGANCNAEGHNQCLSHAAAAIEAQGLKVAP
ncbi:hypothetical protein F3J45_00875 [Pantoea sp. Ap-967]|uniref:hypothetical protein n=1 Tax=Pantoea sp. Ap-967 TaxID=2608362 RepID=UPI00141F6E03|nr:hypothetical protein [Pantoea sp. Ap-967]NIE73019.1 hypothetical protein [Pantoea sp. Ap-967]